MVDPWAYAVHSRACPSSLALGHAGKEIPSHKECWKQFCRDMETQCTDQFLKGIKNKLAQQKLVSDYMIRFERIRNQGKNWLGGGVTRMAALPVLDPGSDQRGVCT